MKKTITLKVNGKEKTLDVDVRMSLLELLRDTFNLTSVKQGCGEGECGACTVIIDDFTVDSCVYLAVWADRRSVRTAESLSEGEKLSVMQEMFIEEGAVQCGFCTPGILMTATLMKESGKKYSRDEIRRALSGHLCRCTGYQKIIDAVGKGLEK